MRHDPRVWLSKPGVRKTVFGCLFVQAALLILLIAAWSPIQIYWHVYSLLSNDPEVVTYHTDWLLERGDAAEASVRGRFEAASDPTWKANLGRVLHRRETGKALHASGGERLGDAILHWDLAEGVRLRSKRLMEELPSHSDEIAQAVEKMIQRRWDLEGTSALLQDPQVSDRARIQILRDLGKIAKRDFLPKELSEGQSEAEAVRNGVKQAIAWCEASVR